MVDQAKRFDREHHRHVLILNHQQIVAIILFAAEREVR